MRNKESYEAPKLEQHADYNMTTGLSIPINLADSTDPLIWESLSLEGEN